MALRSVFGEDYGPVGPYKDYVYNPDLRTTQQRKLATRSGVPSKISPAPVVPQSYGAAPLTFDDKMGRVISKMGNMARDLTPFMSNIANSFRRPGRPVMPTPTAKVNLGRISLDNDRYQVERGIRAANLGAERVVDGNTAAAMSAFNLGQRFNQLSTINQTERNEDKETRNREASINANIEGTNNLRMDKFNDATVERQNIIQTTKSANFANAADKYIAMGNERAKQDLDRKRFGIIQAMYDRDGVAGRVYKTLAEIQADPIGNSYYNDLDKTNKSEQQIVDAVNSATKKRKDEYATMMLRGYKNGGRFTTGKMIKLFN